MSTTDRPRFRAAVARLQSRAADSFNVEPGERRNILLEWHAQPWAEVEASAPHYWSRDDEPWTPLHALSNLLQQPLAAVLVKPASEPWKFAINAELETKQTAAIEDDVAHLIRAHGRGGRLRYAPGIWVNGAAPGDRVWYWPLSSVPGESTL